MERGKPHADREMKSSISRQRGYACRGICSCPYTQFDRSRKLELAWRLSRRSLRHRPFLLRLWSRLRPAFLLLLSLRLLRLPLFLRLLLSELLSARLLLTLRLSVAILLSLVLLLLLAHKILLSLLLARLALLRLLLP